MKKLLFSMSLVAAVSSTGLAQDDAPGNCQLSSVIQIDGKADDWPMPWIVDKDKKISYNACSDDENLYVRLKTSDDLVRRKIGLFGLTVWMDPNGKKKKKLGLRFPTGVEAHERMEAMRQSGEKNDRSTMTSTQRADFQKEINQTMVRDIEVLELIGLSDDPLTSTRSGITNGIKVAIATDEDGAYVYEALIPFKSYRLSKASISTLGVGFETGKYVAPTPKNTGNQGGNTNQGYSGRGASGRGYGGGAGGYGGGGFSSSGQGMRPSYQNNPMSSSTSLWVSVKMK